MTIWETILAGSDFAEFLKLIVCLGEVGGPVGQIEDSKDQGKKVSGDHVDTFTAV